MFQFVCKAMLGAAFAAALIACTTSETQSSVSNTGQSPISEDGLADLVMSGKYDALHSEGNWWSVFAGNDSIDIEKYEHYAVVKAPGSVYDSSWYSIEVFRSPYSMPTRSDTKDEPQYFVRVHHTGSWESSESSEHDYESARRTIFAMQKRIDNVQFAEFRENLDVERFVLASRQADDGVQRTHLNIYAFDLARAGRRDIVTVGWEGFDRFGDAASALDVFHSFALAIFPQLEQQTVFRSKALSSSSQIIE